MIHIYHNPRCSKSRNALQILDEKKINFLIINYLDHPPSFETLSNLISKLGIQPELLIRKKENLFKEKYIDVEFSNTEWILLMCEYPALIERPIVESEYKAIIAKSSDLLEDFLLHHGE
jgi:arsenate reductase